MKVVLLRVMALAAVCLASAVSFVGQTLDADLGRAFSRVDVVQIDAGSKPERIAVSAEGRNYTLKLEPHDIRAANYRAEDTGVSGLRPVERGEVTTFTGKIEGDASSAARINSTPRGLEGFFRTGGGLFFIEPASVYSKSATSGSYVVYRPENALMSTEFACGTDLRSRIEDGKALVNSNRTAAVKRLELATEADLEYVSTLGSVAAANNEILGILNTLEGLYQNELGLTIRVTYQHTWTAAGDPYAAADPQSAVNSFVAYWNANFPYSQYPRDAAHLFSGKTNLQSRGWAWINVVCNRPDLSYGMSGYISWAPGKYLITGHELGHNLGANHADTGTCADTLMNTQLSGSTAVSFCQTSRDEIAGHVANSGSCLTPGQTCRFDFDGDSKADISVFRPSTGAWFVNRSSEGFLGLGFGQNGDKTVAADYDGDGRTDMAVYRGGIWFVLKSTTNTFDGIGFGNATDVPAPADFDGDGKADLAVYRASQGTWYEQLSSNGGFVAYPFGIAEDVPLPADYDGDGKADINVFRPSTGAWFRVNSANSSFLGVGFGMAGDKPVIGDFDGDGKANIAVFRPASGTWFILRPDGSFYGTGFGSVGDIPSPADYDGDGRTDVAVFRPSQAAWFRLDSSTGGFVAYSFGLPTDRPVPSDYIP